MICRDIFFQLFIILFQAFITVALFLQLVGVILKGLVQVSDRLFGISNFLSRCSKISPKLGILPLKSVNPTSQSLARNLTVPLLLRHYLQSRRNRFNCALLFLALCLVFKDLLVLVINPSHSLLINGSTSPKILLKTFVSSLPIRNICPKRSDLFTLTLNFGSLFLMGLHAFLELTRKATLFLDVHCDGLVEVYGFVFVLCDDFLEVGVLKLE